MMRRFMLLLILLASSRAATTGFNYGTSNKANATANQPQSSAPNVEISKEIFSFSPAAEQNADLNNLRDIPIASRNRINVIFIRSPEYPNLTSTLASLVKPNAEQKTIIYVLNKQTDLSGFAHKLHEIKQDSANKPEVRFVRYRTPKEAETAVRNIQNQYVGLGGATQIHADEIAPVVELTSQ